jgi:hypothetical protein
MRAVLTLRCLGLPKDLCTLLYSLFDELDRNMLQAAHQINKRTEFPNGIGIARQCAMKGYVGLLQWLHANYHYDTHCDTMIQRTAIRHGQLTVLQWTHSRTRELTQSDMALAAEYKHYPVFKWIQDNGCRFNECICQPAIKGGNLDIMERVHKVYAFKSEHYSVAAAYGRVHVLQWLWDNGIREPSVGTATFGCAAENGHKDAVKWLFDHGWWEYPGTLTVDISELHNTRE